MFFIYKFKKQIAILVGILIVGAAIWVLYNNTFSQETSGPRIDDTAIIIEEINKIAQLFTANYYDEIAIDSVKFEEKDIGGLIWSNLISPRPGLRSMQAKDAIISRELVVIARGNIRAGYDFSKLDAGALKIEGKIISMYLPEAEILEIIVNPSDYEIFIEEGNWTLEEAVSLKKNAIKILEQRAIERGILEQSRKNAINILSNYFLSLGFDEVKIISEPEDYDTDLHYVPSLE